jgi:hypothetical protein
LHGVYDHIVFARGPGLLPLVTPLLVAMALAAVSVRGELDQEPVSSRRRALLGESPSLRDVQRALRRPNRPLMIHWIAIGAFVTLGTLIAFFAIALLVGRRLGIDFALANEGDARSSAPLILIGAAVLASFPASACLVARASRATSLVEPVIGSGLCIALILLLVALTAPLGVLVAFAMAPAAFLLACGGAWFGLSRQ